MLRAWAYLRWNRTSWSTDFPLSAFVTFALVAAFAHLALLSVPTFDHMAERLGSLQGVLPLYAFGFVLVSGAHHKRCLLLDRLSQSCEKRLVIPQIGDADA